MTMIRKPMKADVVPMERIRQAILLVRGLKVMLDRDLAMLYGVETRALNQAVKRNRERFPDDFMFELTREEIMRLSQSVISSPGLKYSKKVYAFSEQGVAMLSSVLNSPRAIQVNIAIMRAFVQLRAILSTHTDLARKLAEMEKKYDAQFRVVFDALRQLMAPTAPSRKQIGFEVKERAARYGRKAKRSLG
ncbi:MAG: DNA-binding protein [Deltaproteobacteria bacterium]|nr:DNA-binding protein [Deltaproteobacteria bacterium]